MRSLLDSKREHQKQRLPQTQIPVNVLVRTSMRARDVLVTFNV